MCMPMKEGAGKIQFYQLRMGKIRFLRAQNTCFLV